MRTWQFHRLLNGWYLVVSLGWLAMRAVAHAEDAQASPPIEKIYISHFSHTDFGFTDLQTVCRELHRRYLDIALDTVLSTSGGPNKFYWTAESLIAVSDWWEVATPERRADFLRALATGQLEVTAMPCNQTPFLDAAQWRTMMHWIPEELWQQLKPRIALQDDVNGFPRAGAVALLDRGIHRLCMGINSDSGGPPFYRPSAFWWKMPDGRRLFVWLNHHYGSGYDFFETAEWRHGPVPAAADARYRPPRQSDFFRTDEASLRAAQRHCLGRIRQLKKEGYPYNVLAIPVTSQWRMDNDPPFPPIADFVGAWNKLGLKPELVLSTVSQAVEAMEKVAGDKAPEYTGEFTDWWANGTACAPREVAASRMAKRFLQAAESPLWGAWSASGLRTRDALYQDLCLFDEHTWGSSWSIALPWSLDTQAQFDEKAMFAYRPMARAQWLLSQRARTRLLHEGEGLLVANPSPTPYRGWAQLPATSLRGDFHSLVNEATGERLPLRFENGIGAWTRPAKPEQLTREDSSATFPDNIARQRVKFWVENLPAHGFLKLRLDKASTDSSTAASSAPVVQLDAQGWPTSARWPDMSQPLFSAGPGDFQSVKVDAFAPRWVLHDMSDATDAKRRDELRQKHISTVSAEPENPASTNDTGRTIVYFQGLRHPRLKWATRQLELWKAEPRARLTLRFYRLPSADPEIFYAGFELPCAGTMPTLSCGGSPFVPFTDQIPGSCRDYFGIDGWAHYAAAGGHWLWVSRDAPLVTLGSPQVWTRTQTPPPNPQRILSMLYNNIWYTNFAADEPGVMEFQFDLAWRDKLEGAVGANALAETINSDPLVILNASGHDDQATLQRLFEP